MAWLQIIFMYTYIDNNPAGGNQLRRYKSILDPGVINIALVYVRVHFPSTVSHKFYRPCPTTILREDHEFVIISTTFPPEKVKSKSLQS